MTITYYNLNRQERKDTGVDEIIFINFLGQPAIKYVADDEIRVLPIDLVINIKKEN